MQCPLSLHLCSLLTSAETATAYIWQSSKQVSEITAVRTISLSRKNTQCPLPVCVLLSARIQKSGGRRVRACVCVCVCAWGGRVRGVCWFVPNQLSPLLHMFSPTWQQVVFEDGFFDEVVGHQLCAVDQRVSGDVRKCSWGRRNANINYTIAILFLVIHMFIEHVDFILPYNRYCKGGGWYYMSVWV